MGTCLEPEEEGWGAAVSAGARECSGSGGVDGFLHHASLEPHAAEVNRPHPRATLLSAMWYRKDPPYVL